MVCIVNENRKFFFCEAVKARTKFIWLKPNSLDCSISRLEKLNVALPGSSYAAHALVAVWTRDDDANHVCFWFVGEFHRNRTVLLGSLGARYSEQVEAWRVIRRSDTASLSSSTRSTDPKMSQSTQALRAAKLQLLAHSWQLSSRMPSTPSTPMSVNWRHALEPLVVLHFIVLRSMEPGPDDGKK
jgi:hypothetical protein